MKIWKAIKAVAIFFWRRVTCHHEYELKGISLGRNNVHQDYWFECVHCGHKIYVPLASGRTLSARFLRDNELNDGDNTLKYEEDVQ